MCLAAVQKTAEFPYLATEFPPVQDRKSFPNKHQSVEVTNDGMMQKQEEEEDDQPTSIHLPNVHSNLSRIRTWLTTTIVILKEGPLRRL